MATDLIEADLSSDLVPGPVPYAVLLPDGYAQKGTPFPLVLFLHGGGGDRSFLSLLRPVVEQAWERGIFPDSVVATPSVQPRCFYMDFKDGSQRWESFITGPFLDHLRSTYRVRTDRQGTLIFGISMGGMGGLRMAFKHPELFGGVAALEPGIEPVLHWEEIELKHRWWRQDELFEAAFGTPVDPEYWARNNPASIAQADPERLRGSGLEIYIECGDEDLFGLYEGTEFLHRVLYDNRIPHGYRLVRGADHVGRTLGPRSLAALEFLGRVVNPPGVDPALNEPQIVALKKLRERILGQAGRNRL